MNCAADISVGFLNLDPAQRETLTHCIINYSQNSQGIRARVIYLFYMVLENGKMLFGCSTRENAVKALEAKSYKVIPVEVLYFCRKTL